MALTFELETEMNEPLWQTVSSINRNLLKDWDIHRQCLQQQHYYKQSRMEERIAGEQLLNHIKNNHSLIAAATKHCEIAMSSMYKSVIFIITSVSGVVLAIAGPQEITESLNQQYNVGKGSLFSIKNAGLNAISIAIELENWVFLSGAEHDFQLFKEWNCFCSPIRQNGNTMGYLDMSFSVRDDHLLMASLFTTTLRGIEAELGACDQRNSICERFQSYQLSPRETEIGYMWLNNYSALRIASELGIAEGTVRNVIKKVYRKTEVCDKGQFMRKFL